MPSPEDYEAEASNWKQKGNDAFAKKLTEEAVQCYSQGLVALDRLSALSKDAATVKISLLSNRAACYLKVASKLEDCIDDCSRAIELMNQHSTTDQLRVKVLYRRSKAKYLQCNLPTTSDSKKEEHLNTAAKDLLELLNLDPKNKDAAILLNTIRSMHHAAAKSGNGASSSSSPMGKTMNLLKQHGKEGDVAKQIHQMKVLLGLLANDGSNTSIELGRMDGVVTLLDIAKGPQSDETQSADAIKLRSLALQCIACASIHPPFCRRYLVDQQSAICDVILRNNDNEEDIIVGGLSILLRCILHFDRDLDPNEITGKTHLDYDLIQRSLIVAFSKRDSIKCLRAALDVLSTFIAGSEREDIIRASLEGNSGTSGKTLDDHLQPVKTQHELRQLTPKQLSDYRSRDRETRVRNRAWAFERSIGFCTKAKGLEEVLQRAIDTDDVTLRREITVVIGKLFGAMDEMERIQECVGPYLGSKKDQPKDGPKPKKEEEKLRPVIEELPDDYDESKDTTLVETVDDDNDNNDESGAPVTHHRRMERAEIVCALLLATPEVGAWAIGPNGWPTSREDLNCLVESNEKNAMCIAGEVLASAASIKETRPVVASLLTETSMKLLVGHPDRDIRTAAASAIAKIGLAEKGEDEVELMHLLEAACHMLEDSVASSSSNDNKENSNTFDAKTESIISKKLNSTSSASKQNLSSMERGIEVLAYLASKTQIKEEVAHGFEASVDSEHTALEVLVRVAKDVADQDAGEMLFGLASIFQQVAVTVHTLRKESFEGKEITMEQYDEIQKMQKTEEEKDMQKPEPDDNDTPENCAERINKMAAANVPTALVQLLNASSNSSDQAFEQVLLALTRMAAEPSVRGTMIQQGALSALIKIDREDKTPSDQKKKIIRIGQHCMAKLLVTTNPSLLTSAQRLGAIKPLIQLVRDIHAKDLQQFEALMAITNLGASGDDAKQKIIAEKGISSLNFAMFSDHEMVKRAATEAMCNLVPHEKMLQHLREKDTLRLWLALSTDYDDNYECARAAAGGLAMSTQDPEIAKVLIGLANFKERIDSLLQSGRPELMHRVFVMLLNLAEVGEEYRDALKENGMVAFCMAYVQSYNDESKAAELGFAENERGIFNVTIDLAKQIVRQCEK